MYRSRDYKDVRRLLVWLLYASRGGETRLRILTLLKQNGQLNASQLARALKVNYRTVTYHLDILEAHNLIERIQTSHGIYYRLSSAGLTNWDLISKLLKYSKNSGMSKDQH
ncbi:winged helix-turn-helix domain-containing protein [Caldivirga sp.]|mgnify:CR=1 FL=1|uniref:MarR family transcriptional regulator n=1 Tax=Caldivirga sp. TaxID=2080243 RepID=UPI0025BF741A|nr:winged helix-turn-helix domain-containing protein [Caldivirga sp.]